MDELFQRLENRIKRLVAQHHQLRQDHDVLYHGKHKLAHEKNALMTKQLQAISQIETLVSKLKTIEKLP